MSVLDEILKVAADRLLVHSRVSEEKADWRMKICEECDKMSSTDLRCKVCKCYLEVKTAAETNFNPIQRRNEITHCPLGKWGDLEKANEYRKIDGLSPLTET